MGRKRWLVLAGGAVLLGIVLIGKALLDGGVSQEALSTAPAPLDSFFFEYEITLSPDPHADPSDESKQRVWFKADRSRIERDEHHPVFGRLTSFGLNDGTATWAYSAVWITGTLLVPTSRVVPFRFSPPKARSGHSGIPSRRTSRRSSRLLRPAPSDMGGCSAGR